MATKIGVGGCWKNKEEVYQKAWDEGLRIFDDGWGYAGTLANTEFLGKFLADKNRADYQIIEKLPLFDDFYFKNFGFHFDEGNDTQLEMAIRHSIKKQLDLLKTDYIDVYMLHAIYDDKYMANPRLNDINLYKRLIKILIKLKKEGVIRHIGFSAHINFEKLYYFVTEMKKDFGDEVDYAEIAYNILNDKGCDQNNKTFWQKTYGVMVWDAPGLEGLKFLKENGYTVVGMMPTESGRIAEISRSQDWFDWAYRFVLQCKYLDYVLCGTSNPKHLERMLYIERKDYLKVIPNMRKIESGISHCHE